MGLVQARVSAGRGTQVHVKQDALSQPEAALLEPFEDGALAVLALLAADRREGVQPRPRAGPPRIGS